MRGWAQRWNNLMMLECFIIQYQRAIIQYFKRASPIAFQKYTKIEVFQKYMFYLLSLQLCLLWLVNNMSPIFCAELIRAKFGKCLWDLWTLNLNYISNYFKLQLKFLFVFELVKCLIFPRYASKTQGIIVKSSAQRLKAKAHLSLSPKLSSKLNPEA